MWHKQSYSIPYLPYKAFSGISHLPGAILLETQLPDTENRYSYLACEPQAVFEADIIDTSFWTFNRFLETYLPTHFIAGYIGYEACQWIEKLPPPGEKDINHPQIYLAAYPYFWQYDHLQKKWWLWSKESSNKIKPPPPLSMSSIMVKGKYLGANQTKKQYIKNVKAILSYIKAGDVYQVNYTQRFYFEYPSNPYILYLQLRTVQPVNYAAFINTGRGVVISASPELFLRIKGNKILTKPMKGTRPRGKTLSLDRKLEQELMTSSKERAENVMIVDLMRHDLGKFCVPGSIKTWPLFKVETYQTIHQMVSHVTGIIKPGVTLSQILQSTFPPGSVTGAPKKRAMEIIYNLEFQSRGVYTGIIGYAWQREMVFNVAIRTLEMVEQKVVMGSGGGIVVDYEPEAEDAESLLKTKATMEALRIL